MDVRALLAAEKASRRVSHPHLTYEKSGRLLCNVCNLQIRSESLWEGHVKSANHRKNAQAAQDGRGKSLKRKIDDVDTPSKQSTQAVEEVRKKQRASSVEPAEEAQSFRDETSGEVEAVQDTPEPPAKQVAKQAPTEAPENIAQVQTIQAVDEDEWAAFERDVATLAKQDYSSATISAAPMSAAELAAEAENEKRRRREDEAEDEKEDEGRRIEEEFEVMEEFEERVKRLREKREALRMTEPTQAGAGQDSSKVPQTPADEEEDDEDDADDWYT